MISNPKIRPIIAKYLLWRTLISAQMRQDLDHLRRTGATYMFRRRIPGLTIKKILNHTDPDVTAAYDRNSYVEGKYDALVGARSKEDIGRQKSGRTIPLRLDVPLPRLMEVFHS